MSGKKYQDKLKKWTEGDISDWKKLNLGLGVKEIKEKRLMKDETLIEDELTGIERIIAAIHHLNPDEYVMIDGRQLILPFYSSGWEMNAKTFKKRGYAFNLHKETKGEMVKRKRRPQRMFLDIIKKESEKYEFNDENYSYFARRGFHWYNTANNHLILSQVDMLKAIVLSSLIIHYDRIEKMVLSYSNPGGNFNINIPSRKNPKKEYQVKLRNLVTKLPKGYSDWVNIEGLATLPSEDLESRINIYGNESNRTIHSEQRLNHTVLTAIILRQHFNDERFDSGKFNSKKYINEKTGKNSKKYVNKKISEGHSIPRVLLNITPLPKKDFLEFYLKLQNNVLISERIINKSGKPGIRLKKLNQAQEEALISVRSMLYPNKTYYNDDTLNSLDGLTYLTLEEAHRYTGIKIDNLAEEEKYLY